MARALLAPLAIQSVPWDVLQSKLQTHYAPKPLQITCQHVFYHQNQAEGVRDIKLQWCLFAKTDLTLQMALDKAQAAEMSNQSMAEIQKSNSPLASWKPVTVHHEDASHSESADEDDDIYHLKSSKGRNVATEKRQPAWVGCGSNHL
ncbi:hypothetical protein E2320_002290 [Naja naja]|nr:hypothetical protein E2320_002290 [Naja naja]